MVCRPSSVFLKGKIYLMLIISTLLEGEELLYYLRIIKKNTDLLLFMINDILDFGRLEKN
jgi:signal transduction histidine kinase